MPSHRWYLTYGGGLGDVVYDFLRCPGAWRMGPLSEMYDADIRIYTLCHNDGVSDVFRHNPYVTSHIAEPWHPPCPEDHVRFNNAIDGYLPLQNDAVFYREYGVENEREEPKLYLSQPEKAQLAGLMAGRPLIVAQPFAGLSDRDGFDSAAFERLVAETVALDSRVRFVVVGKNHERGHKYTREELLFSHPNVVNLIDKAGIRFCFHLVANCDAFVGCHSNLIRTAWDFRRRNVCVLPEPLMTDHLDSLDAKYTYGFRYQETAKFTFPFAAGGPRQFELLDCKRMAAFLLGRE
jgi:hypothetical protein